MKHARILIVALFFVSLYGFVAARKGATRSGNMKDNVYADATYHFRLTLSDDWKPSLFDQDSPSRLLLIHKDLKSTTKANGREVVQSVTPVKVEFWAIVDSTIDKGLVDSLVSSTFKSDIKDKILASPEGFWDVTGFERIEGGVRKIRKFGAVDGVVWKGGFVYKSTIVSPLAIGVALIGADCGSYQLLALMYCNPADLDVGAEAAIKVMSTLVLP
ncbi:MAG: hypothetical protein WAU88_16070 [Candidatus Zixiibacteriota bacterium]